MRLARATVVGGGIGGAATALLLARAGTETTLLERSPEPRQAGAALALAANGLAVLDRLGLGHEVRARGTVLQRGVLRDERGRVLAAVRPAVLDPGYDHVAVVARSALLEALYDAVDASPRIEVRLGADVDAATVTRLDGGLVVGADGVGSVVRATLAFDADVHDLRTTYVRALLPADVPGHLVGEWWTPAGLVGVLPMGDLTYFYASADAARLATAVATRDVESFRDAWSAAVPPLAGVLETLTDFDQLLVNDVAEVHCGRFTYGRTALVGDAAHAMAPNLGQGANSALVDAVVLVAQLEAAATLPEALAAFDARRRPRVGQVQATARRLLRLSAAHGPAVRAARRALLRLTRGAMSSRRAAMATMQERPGWLAASG